MHSSVRTRSVRLLGAALFAAACAAPPEPPSSAASIVPRVFAPGVVSTGLRERDAAWAPDGTRFLHSVFGQGRGTILEHRCVDGVVGPAAVASFSGAFSDIEPFFDPRGGRLWFASDRPLPGESAAGDWNLWSVAVAADGGYGAPEPYLPSVGDGDEFYPSVTRDGVVYFTAQRPDSLGGEDLYRIASQGGVVENLGPTVNGPGPEFNAFVAPDAAYLLFSSVRDGDVGGGDLYVAFGDGAGGFLPAQNLGPALNSPQLDYCPFVTADGRTLLFTSHRSGRAPDDHAQRDLATLLAELHGPENGQGSVYEVAFEVVARLRPQANDDHDGPSGRR